MTAPTTPSPPPVPVREIGYARQQSASAWWASAELETTPELRWPLSVGIYERMRRQDAQVGAVLRALFMPIRRTRWGLDQDDASDEVARVVSADLGLPLNGAARVPTVRNRDRFSWRQHLVEALLHLVFGHMPFEQQYREDPEGLYRLRKLGARLPSTLSAINVARDGGLISIQQHGVDKPIPVNRLVMYVNEREGGDWLGKSLLRSAYGPWLIKDRMFRVWAQTIERNGMGVPIYEAGEGETSLDAGQALATGFRSGENAGGAIPNGAKLTLTGVTGELPDAERIVRYADEQIGRSVLAHFLNLNAQGGSYALASVQADTFTESLQALAEYIAEVATQHIVEDIVDINFGPDVPAPRVTFQEIGSRNQITAAALKMLIESGALTPGPELQRFVRENYGIPGQEDA